jgi:hypothetical protein
VTFRIESWSILRWPSPDAVTDVMIFKIFLLKHFAKKLVFFAQNKAKSILTSDILIENHQNFIFGQTLSLSTLSSKVLFDCITVLFCILRLEVMRL